MMVLGCGMDWVLGARRRARRWERRVVLPLPLGPVRSAICPALRERRVSRWLVWSGDVGGLGVGACVRPMPNLPQALRRRGEAVCFPMSIRLMVIAMAGALGGCVDWALV